MWVCGGDAGAAAEDDLGAHELAVVLAERAGEGFVAGVAGVGGLRSTPRRRRRAAGVGWLGSRRWGGGGWFESWRARRSLGPLDGAGLVAGYDAASSGCGSVGGDELPLEFGGETVAGPAGVGVGFEEAEVADGGFGEVVEGLPAVQGEDAPAGVGGGVATPVEGRLPGVRRWRVSQPSESQSSGRA